MKFTKAVYSVLSARLINQYYLKVPGQLVNWIINAITVINNILAEFQKSKKILQDQHHTNEIRTGNFYRLKGIFKPRIYADEL